MATEKTEEIYDISAISRQAAGVIAGIGKVTAAMEASAAKIVKCNQEIAASGSYDELTKSSERFIKVNREMAQQTKELAQLQGERFQMEQKLQQACLQMVKRVAEVRQEVAAEAKAIREAASAVGDKEKTDVSAMKTLGEMISVMKQQREAVAALTEENSRLRAEIESLDYATQRDEITQLNDLIAANTALIALNTEAYGNQGVSMENVRGVADSLIAVLKGVQEGMAQAGGSGGVGALDLEKLGKGLDDAISKLEAFSSRNGELTQKSAELQAAMASLAGEQATVSAQMARMAEDGQVASQGYGELMARSEELKECSGQLGQQLLDVNGELAGMAVPDVMFEAFSAQLMGVAGVCETARGTLNLFGVESEGLNQIMGKLQAVLTIVNGVMAVKAALTKQAALSEALHASASSGGVVVSKAATVAQWALNAARAADPVFLIVSVLVACVAAMGSWMASAKEMTAEQQRQNDVQSNAIDGYAKEKTEIDSLAASMSAGTATVEERARATEIMREKCGDAALAGKTQQEIEDAFVNSASDFVAAAQAKAEAQAAFELAVESQKKALQTGSKGVEEYVGWWERLFRTEEQEAELAQKRREEEQKAEEANTQAYLEIQRKKQEEEKKLKEKSGEIAKEEQQEKEKSLKAQDQLRLLGVKSEADAQKRILQDSKASYKEKEAALQASVQKQIEVIRLQQNFELKKTTNKDERALITQKAEDDVLKIRQQGKELRKKLDEEEKKVALQLEDEKAEGRRAVNQRIMDDDTLAMGTRLTAQLAFEADKKASVERQMTAELEAVAEGSQQYQLIRSQAQNELNTIEQQGYEAREQIQNDEVTRQVKNMYDVADQSKEVLEKQYSDDQAALARRYGEGKMSAEEYEKGKLDLSQKYSQDVLQTEIDGLQNVIDNSGLKGEELAEVKKALADKQLEQTKMNNEQAIAENEKTAQKRAEIEAQCSKMMQESVTAVFSLMNAASERKIQEIDEEMEKVDEQKEHDLALLDEMDISDEERTARKAEIENAAEQKKGELEKKKKEEQLKQAKMQKAQALIDVAINTAVAVMAAWGNPFTAPVMIPMIIATGAIQAAVIAAQPLPKYAHGTEDHPGGLAMVGDGGRQELVFMPDGGWFVTPDKPTLVDLPKHSEVIPDFSLALKSLALVPSVSDGAVGTLRVEQRLEALEKAIRETTEAVRENRPQTNISLDRNGLWTTYENGKGRTSHLNRGLKILR